MKHYIMLKLGYEPVYEIRRLIPISCSSVRRLIIGDMKVVYRKRKKAA